MLSFLGRNPQIRQLVLCDRYNCNLVSNSPPRFAPTHTLSLPLFPDILSRTSDMSTFITTGKEASVNGLLEHHDYICRPRSC
jgi:hypothetical protein